MTKGKLFEKKLRQYFAEARELMMPKVTDEMLCDEGDGEKIYYMNGNDGTDFDWSCNERLCEFFMFYKSTEMGFIKVFVKNDDTLSGYIYKEDYKYGDKPTELKVEKIPNGTATYMAALMYEMADRKTLYDKPISEINFDYEPSEFEIDRMGGCDEEVEEDEVTYRYDVYYDGTWLHEDSGFYYEWDARSDAELYVESKIADWEVDGVEYDGDLFEIEVEGV